MASSSRRAILVKQVMKLKFFISSSSAVSLQTRCFSSIDYDESYTNHGRSRREQHMNNPPEPIPNRPLRGERPERPERPSNPSRPVRRQQQPSADFSKPPQTGTSPLQSFNPAFDQRKKTDGGAQSDQSFLEQFKLGVDRNKEKFPTPQSEQQHKVSESPLPAPEDADEIFKKMKETGLIPNAVAMLDGLCKDGLVQEAMKLFGLMREKGTLPEVVIYTAVVDGFCKSHKMEDAKRIFRRMQSNGITPNAFSYTVLILGLYKCNKIEDAVEFCVEMLEAGHSPNVTTFVGLVDGLCKEKGVEEARRVIAVLRQKGFVMNEKAVREFLDKKAPFSSMVWEAILDQKAPKKPF